MNMIPNSCTYADTSSMLNVNNLHKVQERWHMLLDNHKFDSSPNLTRLQLRQLKRQISLVHQYSKIFGAWKFGRLTELPNLPSSIKKANEENSAISISFWHHESHTRKPLSITSTCKAKVSIAGSASYQLTCRTTAHPLTKKDQNCSAP
jgi:ABC-type arginine transport system ATPase subunit